MANMGVYPSIPDLLAQAVSRYPNHRAIVFDGRITDFTTFDRVTERVAAGLAERGISKGDRVALYCVNSDFFAIAYFGIVRAGAVVVPINLLLNPKEIAYILQDSGACAMIYFAAFDEAIGELRDTVPACTTWVRIGATPAPDGVEDWQVLLTATAQATEVTLDPAEDLVAILYTSGTTGKHKGAMLTHRNLASNVQSIREALGLVPSEEIMLVVLPMFHAFAATVGLLFPILNGCTIVPLPRFDPEQVARTIAEQKATFFMGVPSMYSVLLRLPETSVHLMKGLRLCVSGGAALPVEVMRQFEQKFGHPIYEGDGPTECSPVTCVNPIGGVRKPASVGRPVPNVEMRILDSHGVEQSVDEIGEICVRGPNVMKGYWGHPEETRAAFFGEWFRTGDLGYKDDDGYFFIVDRIKDMIIVNGMNVYPRVIEEVLYRFPPIREAAVVGEPNALHGEIAVAFVALNDGAEATPQQIRAFCQSHLGRHEIPRKIHIIPDLPKNAAGKILKRELRKSGEVERGVRGIGPTA